MQRISVYICVSDVIFILLRALVYKNMSEAVSRHPNADVLVNFASLRSAYEATVEAMSFNKVRSPLSFVYSIYCGFGLMNRLLFCALQWNS